MYLRSVQINVKDKATHFRNCNCSSCYSLNKDSEAVLSDITFNYIMNMLNAKPWIKKIYSAARMGFKGFLLLSYDLCLGVCSPASWLQCFT